MGLESWIDEHSTEDLFTLAEAIEAGEVADERVDALQELIEETPETVREDAVAETEVFRDGGIRSAFNALEEALGLQMTPPPGLGVGGPVEETGMIGDEDRQDALDSLDRLLSPTSGRGFDFFANIAQALESGSAEPTPMFTQDTLDALTEADRDRLADRARDLRDEAREYELEDFPEIQRKLRRLGGRGVGYFENIIAELRGEIEPDRLPEDSLERIWTSDAALNEAIGEAEDAIEGLQDNGNGGRGGGGGGGGLNLTGGAGGFSPAPTAGPDVGDEEPYEDTDYITGESITRDPVFEERFVQLAQDLGRASDLDLIPLPPDDYFALSLENQEKYYDVTPFEFMRRAMVRGDVTRDQLINHYGFDPDGVPMEGDGGER